MHYRLIDPRERQWPGFVTLLRTKFSGAHWSGGKQGLVDMYSTMTATHCGCCGTSCYGENEYPSADYGCCYEGCHRCAMGPCHMRCKALCGHFPHQSTAINFVASKRQAHQFVAWGYRVANRFTSDVANQVQGLSTCTLSSRRGLSVVESTVVTTHESDGALCDWESTIAASKTRWNASNSTPAWQQASISVYDHKVAEVESTNGSA